MTPKCFSALAAVTAALLCGPVTAALANTPTPTPPDGGYKIMYVNVDTDGGFYFGLNRVPACETPSKNYILRVAADTPGADRLLSTVLAAYLSGRKIIAGADTRTDWGCTLTWVELR